MYFLGSMLRTLLLFITFLSLVLKTSGLTQVGNGDLVLVSDLDISYDSNVLIRQSDELDDIVGTLYAGLMFVQRERSVLNASLEIGSNITRMADLSELNSEDWRSSFEISYPNNIDSRSYYSLSGGYNETTQANADVGRRIKNVVSDLEGSLRRSLSEKLSVNGSVGYSDQQFENIVAEGIPGIRDRSSEDFDFSIGSAYNYSERLSGTLSYSYQTIEYDGGTFPGQSSDVLAVGLSGQLSPRLSGSVSGGIRKQDISSPFFEDYSSTDPYYSIDLTWAARERTSVSVSGATTTRASANGEISDSKDFQVSVNERLSERSGILASVSISEDDYTGLTNRSDESLRLSVSYTLTVGRDAGFRAGISYEDRTSNSNFGYQRYIADLGFSKSW